MLGPVMVSSGGSWGLGPMGPAILWSHLQGCENVSQVGSGALVPGSGKFQLSRLAGLGYGLGLGFWVVITIIVSLTRTLTLITTLTVILPYPQFGPKLILTLTRY